MNLELQKAMEAARAAGALLRENFGKTHRIHFKGPVDMVTEMDRRAEELIAGMLQEAFPNYGFWGEEGGRQGTGMTRHWVVDPLDGTTNYAHNYPFFAVSIGLEEAGELLAGVVYDPIRDELFAAQRGDGAMLNGRPIRVSTTAELGQSLLASGFPYDAWISDMDNGHEWHRFLKCVQSLRADGAAALDFCYVAAGRVDGYWELTLKPWDMAAGALIVQEAGGRVSRLNGEPLGLDALAVVASNGSIHDAMIEILLGTGP